VLSRSNAADSGSASFAWSLRRRRCAESWIGVSGFLISCAMRRATSRQAAMRCTRMISVTSSTTTTKPAAEPLASCMREIVQLSVRTSPATATGICRRSVSCGPEARR
jgi:hypothetical protein